MSGDVQRQWLIARRPVGRPLEDADFELAPAPVRAPQAGEVRLRTLYLSFDPAQKSWMENAAGYMEPVEIGGVMPGWGVGLVAESAHAEFHPGDLAYGLIGWSEQPTLPAAGLVKVPAGVPANAALSMLGITGRTAYLGLMKVGRPVAGDTLVISGAAGATGSLVGQIGKLAGCRVIGIAGGAEKCALLVDKLGFDAAIDYREGRVRSRLRELAPHGVDIFFDNVGGEVLNDVLARLAPRARVVICGAIARYNFDPRSAEMPEGPRNYFNLVFTGATIQGFLTDHYERDFAEADRRLIDWLRTGRITPLEDVQVGFENAPAALRRLFEGRNLGKQMLKLS